MADILYDLLQSQQGGASTTSSTPDADALAYLTSLASKPLADLDTTEPQALSQASHSLLLNLQSLSKRSHKPIIKSAEHHATLCTSLPALAGTTSDLRAAIPRLDAEAVKFSTTYSRSASSITTTSAPSTNANPTAAGAEADPLFLRRRALLLTRNVERLVDVLELPTLLASAIASTPPNYASALDLNGHIRRLASLYPKSPLVRAVAAQADDAMRDMAAGLVSSLKSPQLKLAASLRTVSWLRRVLPDLEAGVGKGGAGAEGHDSQERVLGALFLVCRLSTLMGMLDALDPLRELADQERQRQKSIGSGNAWSGGQQTERYLKRYIEIFREQSFAIVSMFKSIFPVVVAAEGEDDGAEAEKAKKGAQDPLEPLPAALSTFPLHLVDMLLTTLREYLPTVKDQASRDSLLTQVLYCAGSLGRLGGDFGLFLATLDVGGGAEEEWVEVVKRHRLLAGRLESIVGDQKGKRG